MATPSYTLINALQTTADNLEHGAPYQWGHMGSCNCGNLAQTITGYTKQEIHAQAMQKYGDWNTQIQSYCPISGLHIDQIVRIMLEQGLTTSDLQHLERLSDPEILAQLPAQNRNLKHNNKQHVVLYLRTWADMLHEKLVHDLVFQGQNLACMA